MLYLQNATKVYNDNPVLNQISLSVNSKDVVALIGDNGTGKTTLMKILSGEVEPTSGKVTSRDEYVYYVAQDIDNLDETIETYFGNIESWRVNYGLDLVGLNSTDRAMCVGRLSGGQKTRLMIAKALALEPRPTTLLFDEPTNNLDSNGLIWLEKFIKNFNGAIVFASHDRVFINKVAKRVIEIKNGKIKNYGGNYDFYKQQRMIEIESQKQKYHESIQEKERLKRLAVIAKNRAKNGVSRRKSKDNDKMCYDFKNQNVQNSLGRLSKALESRSDRLQIIDMPDFDKNYSFQFSGSVNNGKLLIKLKNLNKSFGDKHIINDFSFDIRGGDRIYLDGVNGSGKTTLLNIIAGKLLPDGGEIVYADNVKIGYFSQVDDSVDYSISVYENLCVVIDDDEKIYHNARSLGLDVKSLAKKPAELSRGQLAKLAFIKLLSSDCEILILDEPTNHLDISTKELLERALNKYAGAMIVTSHDKYFLDQIEINKTLLLHDGSIQAYAK